MPGGKSFWDPLPDAASLPGAWTPYTPTWTGNGGTQPAIGNGVFDAAYVQFGKTVMFRMSVVFGSTSTFGDGRFRFTLPVTAKALGTNHGLNITGYAENNAIAGYLISAGTYITSTTFSLNYHVGTTAGDIDTAGNTQPFTWGDTDYIKVHGFYEAA